MSNIQWRSANLAQWIKKRDPCLGKTNLKSWVWTYSFWEKSSNDIKSSNIANLSIWWISHLDVCLSLMQGISSHDRSKVGHWSLLYTYFFLYLKGLPSGDAKVAHFITCLWKNSGAQEHTNTVCEHCIFEIDLTSSRSGERPKNEKNS